MIALLSGASLVNGKDFVLIIVSNETQFYAALRDASGGEVIALSPDHRFSIKLDGYNIPEPGVTITSADSQNRSVIETAVLSNSSNITFDNLIFSSELTGDTRPDWYSDIYLSASSNITFKNSEMYGDAETGFFSSDAHRAETFATVQNSDQITFENNDIRNYFQGLTILETTNIRIVNNSFHELQADAIRMAGVQDVAIDGNRIQNFLGTAVEYNHMDAIQIWSTNTTLVTKNISITNNIIDAGANATESIFIRNEQFDASGGAATDRMYENITITGNLIYNGHSHGIAVGGTDGVVIENNTLVLNTDSYMRSLESSNQYTPSIQVNLSTDVTIVDNIVGNITSPEGSNISNNILIDYFDKTSEFFVGKLFVNATAGSDAGMTGLLINPDGPLMNSGIGSNLNSFDMTPATLTPAFTYHTIDGSETRFLFDASLTADAEGWVQDGHVKFVWSFEDGTSVTGRQVEHVFEDFGRQSVTLAVVSDKGETASWATAINVTDPVLLDLWIAPDSIVDKSSYESSISYTAGAINDGYHVASGAALGIGLENEQLFGLDQFSLSVGFKRDSPAVGEGIIVNLHTSYRLEVLSSGELKFELETAEGSKYQIVTSGASLKNTDWHYVTVSFDGLNHSAELFLDGVEVGSTVVQGVTQPREYWGLTFGLDWTGSFSGTVGNITLTSDPTTAEDALTNAKTFLDRSTGLSLTAPDPSFPPNELPGGDGSSGNGGPPIANVIKGTDGNDRMDGTDGSDDTLDGGAGADTMRGGAGNDVYVVDNASDIVDESPAGSSGIDTVKSSISFELTNTSRVLGAVENLTLLGSNNINATGNALDNVLIGNAGANVLTGGRGNDTLNGGAGADTMRGGVGNDVYVVDNVGDVVDESLSGSDGTDTVQSSISFNLANASRVLGAVENLTLLGSANINATGNGQSNLLTGNAGANVLDGGAGADTMTGSAGDDVYVVDNSGDTIDESLAGSSGNDTIQSMVSFDLTNTTRVLGEVENLILLGSANISAKGNALSNVLVGNSGANVLQGGAGNDTLDGRGGKDTMAGGAGNDLYLVDNTGDFVNESLAGSNGIDTIQSSVTFDLANSARVLGALENLTLIGSANINATGNGLNNVLIGNLGDNTLNGGAGADRMGGGAGNDVYVVDNVGDIVDESMLGSNGIDTINSLISFDLTDTNRVLGSVENLKLFGGGNINATGNALDNVLMGNSGTNKLIGGAGDDTLNGGAGKDTLAGGDGNDLYIVDNLGDLVDERVAGSNGVDTVHSSVTFDLGNTARVLGLVENLTLLGSSNINAVGNALDNILHGNSGANKLYGNAGNDTLYGGLGKDELTGGSGADRFIFGPNSGADRLLDFNPLEDTLVFQGLNFQSVEQVLQGAIDVKGDLVISLDGQGASSSHYVTLAGVSLDEVSHANISIFVA